VSAAGRVLSIIIDVLMTLFMLILVGSLIILAYYFFIYNRLPQWF
jgi:hypothetical protein